jgi:ABC-2 type transport system ATP-binding protein
VAIIDHGVIKVAGSPIQLKLALGGDILSIQVTDGPDLSHFLGGVKDVTEVTRLDNITYRIKVPRGEQALLEILSGISQRGMRIQDISFSRPTLDQVFLQVTGRSLRDGEGHASLVAPELMEKVN